MAQNMAAGNHGPEAPLWFRGLLVSLPAGPVKENSIAWMQKRELVYHSPWQLFTWRPAGTWWRFRM